MTAAIAAGEVVGGETEIGLAVGGVTTAGPGGDFDLESEELTRPESWIASTTLCQRHWAYKALMVLGKESYDDFGHLQARVKALRDECMDSILAD